MGRGWRLSRQSGDPTHSNQALGGKLNVWTRSSATSLTFKGCLRARRGRSSTWRKPTIARVSSITVMHLKHAHAQNMTLATKTTHTHKDLLTLSRGHSSLPNQNQPLTKSLFFAIPLMGRQTQRSVSGQLIRRE